MLFHLTPYAGRMRLALAPMRLLQRMGLGGLVRRMGRLLPRSLRLMQDIVPPLAPHYGRLPEVLPAEGQAAGARGPVHRLRRRRLLPANEPDTARVLQRNGCEVWIPRTQVCCGALHYHAGLEKKAEQLAADNCRAFGKGLEEGLDKVDAIINNAGGCGPVLKEYGHLLEKTPDAGVGAAFAAKVRDISEFLVELGPVKPTHPLPIKATYHDACGLSHAQKIRQPPRQLLALIPGLELVPLAESEALLRRRRQLQPHAAGDVARAGPTQGEEHRRHGGASGVQRQRRLHVADHPPFTRVEAGYVGGSPGRCAVGEL